MGANGLRCSGLAVDAARVATHRPIMLPVSAFRNLSQPAPFGFDALGKTIGKSPAPIHGHDHADGNDHRYAPANELDRELRQSLIGAVCGAVFDRQALPFDEAGFRKTPSNRRDRGGVQRQFRLPAGVGGRHPGDQSGVGGAG